MHVQCPNCQASFRVTQDRLPTPKFNGDQSSYGWKFECGHCDTKWWVGLAPHDLTKATSPRSARFAPMHAYQNSAISYAPPYSTTYPESYPQSITPPPFASVFRNRLVPQSLGGSAPCSYPSLTSPIAEHEAGFGRYHNASYLPSDTLRLSGRSRWSIHALGLQRHKLYLKKIGFFIVIFLLLGFLAYHYHTFLLPYWMHFMQMIQTNTFMSSMLAKWPMIKPWLMNPLSEQLKNTLHLF